MLLVRWLHVGVQNHLTTTTLLKGLSSDCIMASMNLNTFIILLCTLLAYPLSSGAQALSPRAYWPSPVGTNVLTVGYSHLSGDVVPDRSLPITGVDSSIDSMILGYRHTFNMWGRTTNITVEAPYVDGSTRGTHENGPDLQRDYNGLGDIGATLSVNILGAPSMSRQEFRERLSSFEHMLGASVKVVAPTGEYDNKRILNVGTNRWAAKAELGYISILNPKWIFEMSLGAWFFEDNDDFLDFTKEQDPLVSLQGHLIHRFRRGLWVSLDANYYEGGRSTIGGRRLNDLQRDSKVGATLVFPFAKGHAVKVGYSKGSVNDSDEDFDIFIMSYQQLF